MTVKTKENKVQVVGEGVKFEAHPPDHRVSGGHHRPVQQRQAGRRAGPGEAWHLTGRCA